MASKLSLPLDPVTVDGLRKLGQDIIARPKKRAAFLKDPKGTMAAYGVQNINPNRLDEQVVKMIADPVFAKVVQAKDVRGIREFVHNALADRIQLRPNYGTFDYDFDFEVEVEVVVVAVAVFDFAVVAVPQADPAELMRRRQIVANAFEALGKKLNK
jgi:hypothetical protein